MLVPGATVFFSSGCIMILELVASRLVARALGSSLYTWTSIIAVVLAGLSIGNYLGGRIADRFHARRALSVLFALSSAACIAIVIVNNVIGNWTWLWRFNWPGHVFLHVSLVFLAPSALLGTIGPVVAKMALDQGFATGRTVGAIYAWGAAGSIAGTLLAGFFLIASFGSVRIIWVISAAMLAMAFLYWVSCWALYLWGMVFAALVTIAMAPADWAHVAGVAAGLREPHDPTVIYEDETPYCHVVVRRVSETPDRRAFWQDQLMHSEIVMGDVTSLQYFYTEIYAGLTRGLSTGDRPLSIMVIGGGGYAFPQYLKAFWPDSRVEVVEIDPGVTEAAMEAFGLAKDTSIRTINMDARNYVDQLLRGERSDRPTKQYDFIYEDAINDYSVPFQLVTKEFNEKVARLLAANGAYLVNLIDTYESGRFLGAVLNTLEQTFAYVWVIGNRIGLPSLRDTYVVVASHRDFDPRRVLREYNEHLAFWVLDDSEMAYLRDRGRHVVLTDDYAPVENMLAPVVRQGAKERLARRYLRHAAELESQGRYDQSIAEYQQAVEQNPSMAIKAYNAIGVMRVEQGDLQGAADAFRSAISSHTDSGLQQTAIASVHMNLGILLQKTGKSVEAQSELAEAVKWFRIDLQQNPRSVRVWDSLGDTLALMANFKEATDAFEKAVALDPDNLAYYQKLSKALEFQKRYDEAIAVVRRQIELLSKQGRHGAALEMGRYVDFLEYQKVKKPD